MTKLNLCVLALSLGAALVPRSFGQTSAIGIFKVAFDEPTSPKEQEFARPIILKIRQPAKVPEEFYARLFRGSVESLKAQRPNKQGCVYFSTARFPVKFTGAIEIPALGTERWLNPVGDGFQPQDYSIVFEGGDEPTKEIFIDKKELDNYFRYAFSIRLLPPDSLKGRVLDSVREVTEFLQSGRVPVQDACWGVKTVLAAHQTSVPNRGIVKVAELRRCREEPAIVTALAAEQ
jgi:hypothetical protein